mmetsp:Transcript_7874/g.25070  ORF Transcript_7874/g.25070 Transcript_7874/m.25070 type:complete len:243 (-) Transcript_7874:123-851(-)
MDHRLSNRVSVGIFWLTFSGNWALNWLTRSSPDLDSGFISLKPNTKKPRKPSPARRPYSKRVAMYMLPCESRILTSPLDEQLQRIAGGRPLGSPARSHALTILEVNSSESWSSTMNWRQRRKWGDLERRAAMDSADSKKNSNSWLARIARSPPSMRRMKHAPPWRLRKKSAWTWSSSSCLTSSESGECSWFRTVTSMGVLVDTARVVLVCSMPMDFSVAATRYKELIIHCRERGGALRPSDL